MKKTERTGLKKMFNERKKFKGTFDRYGIKTNWHGFPETTLLFKNIVDCNGNEVADHLWFNQTKGFIRMGILKEGDLIEFEARVSDYVKGYVNRREYIDDRTIDYKLNRPTKIARVPNQ